LDEQAEYEREETSVLALFPDPDLPPRTVHAGLDALGEVNLSQLEEVDIVDGPFIVSPPIGLDFETEKDEKVALKALRVHGFLTHAMEASLVFEGFPRSFWVKCRGENEFFLGEDWTWRNEEGTLVGVKETFEKIVPVAAVSSLLLSFSAIHSGDNEI